MKNEKEIIELIEYAKKIYINYLKKNKFPEIQSIENKLNELKVKFIKGSNAQASISSKTKILSITENFPYNDKTLALKIIFHEFVHYSNSINYNIVVDFENSLLKNFLEENNVKNEIIKRRYLKFAPYGFLMMDETIAEEISTNIMEQELKIKSQNKQYKLCSLYEYESNFGGYHIFKPIMKEFCKTLNCELIDFCKASYGKQFISILYTKLNSKINGKGSLYLELLSLMGYFTALYYALVSETVKKSTENFSKKDTVDSYLKIHKIVNVILK